MTWIKWIALGLALSVFSGCSGLVDKQARREFHASRGRTLTLFPAIVHSGRLDYDDIGSRWLADSLTKAGLVQAKCADGHVPVTIAWRANEAAMWKRSAQEFQHWLLSHPFDTDYALLPEILIQPYGVVGVHGYLVDRQGHVAGGWLQNSHWKEFKLVGPSNAAGGLQVLLLAIKHDMEAALPTP